MADLNENNGDDNHDSSKKHDNNGGEKPIEDVSSEDMETFEKAVQTLLNYANDVNKQELNSLKACLAEAVSWEAELSLREEEKIAEVVAQIRNCLESCLTELVWREVELSLLETEESARIVAQQKLTKGEMWYYLEACIKVERGGQQKKRYWETMNNALSSQMSLQVFASRIGSASVFPGIYFMSKAFDSPSIFLRNLDIGDLSTYPQSWENVTITAHAPTGWIQLALQHNMLYHNLFSGAEVVTTRPVVIGEGVGVLSGSPNNQNFIACLVYSVGGDGDDENDDGDDDGVYAYIELAIYRRGVWEEDIMVQVNSFPGGDFIGVSLNDHHKLMVIDKLYCFYMIDLDQIQLGENVPPGAVAFHFFWPIVEIEIPDLLGCFINQASSESYYVLIVNREGLVESFLVDEERGRVMHEAMDESWTHFCMYGEHGISRICRSSRTRRSVFVAGNESLDELVRYVGGNRKVVQSCSVGIDPCLCTLGFFSQI